MRNQPLPAIVAKSITTVPTNFDKASFLLLATAAMGLLADTTCSAITFVTCTEPVVALSALAGLAALGAVAKLTDVTEAGLATFPTELSTETFIIMKSIASLLVLACFTCIANAYIEEKSTNDLLTNQTGRGQNILAVTAMRN